MSAKMVYVPRNWKVSYVDAIGNEHADVALCANAEYRIVENGVPYNVTVSGIRVEEGKTYILAKVLMQSGFMNVMKQDKTRRFDVNEVTEITRITTKYVKASRYVRGNEGNNVFTFAFDSEKFASQYRISVHAGEFVALALKDSTDPNRKSRSIYGHIVDVDTKKNEIVFSRYVAKRGVRDVYETTVSLNSLLGIYRYELEINDYEEVGTADPMENNSATEAVVDSTPTTEE